MSAIQEASISRETVDNTASTTLYTFNTDDFYREVKSKGKSILNFSFKYHKTHQDEAVPALHMAAKFGDPHIMNELLQFGAAIDVKDATGRLPLHYWVSRVGKSYRLSGDALKSYQQEEQKVLEELTKKSSINTQDKMGNTPLHMAMERFGSCPGEEYWNVVHALLRAGADSTIKNRKGDLPIDVYRFTHWEEDNNSLEATKYDNKFQEFILGSVNSKKSEQSEKLLRLILDVDEAVARFFHIDRYGLQLNSGASGYDTSPAPARYESNRRFLACAKERAVKAITKQFDELYSLWSKQKEPLQFPQTFKKLEQLFAIEKNQERVKQFNSMVKC